MAGWVWCGLLAFQLSALCGAAAATNRVADLSRLVVVGDSLLAGFQNGALLDRQQTNGIVSLLARQAKVDLPLPLIGAPGIPNVLRLVTPGLPPALVRDDGASTGRVDVTLQPMNLAVPGATVEDALTNRPALPVDNLTDLILGLPGLLGGIARSQVEWAEALRPTTIIIWIGNNDTLGAALAGDASLITPEAVFRVAFTELMSRLAATGAALVVANIPDVTVIPYFISADLAASVAGAPLALVGPLLGISSGDYILPDAIPLAIDILTQKRPGPLPANLILDASEIVALRNATAAFNGIITEQAQARGAALVDTHAFLNQLKENGLLFNGAHLTTEILGGIFSLDGIHPTQIGAAATANEFIKVLNTQFAASIPLLDPLVPPPSLFLQKNGTNLVITWPASALGFALESSGNLSSTTWSNVPGQLEQVGELYTISDPISANLLKFYRLRRP